MRTSEFDSSSEDEEVGEEQLTPFHISWLPLSIVECSQFLGICALPGCRYKEIRRSLQRDVEELQNQGVQTVFVFCTRGELNKYRVPSLLEVYEQQGFTVHHMPFPDGDAPELERCCQILEELRVSLENNRRTVIQIKMEQKMASDTCGWFISPESLKLVSKEDIKKIMQREGTVNPASCFGSYPQKQPDKAAHQ
uniref:protein-tyrosine-phosphatase n=1 Tax=Lates calcarifer TaxID=8187 RepID=A0A4W6FK06_LATCA